MSNVDFETNIGKPALCDLCKKRMLISVSVLRKPPDPTMIICFHCITRMRYVALGSRADNNNDIFEQIKKGLNDGIDDGR